MILVEAFRHYAGSRAHWRYRPNGVELHGTKRMVESEPTSCEPRMSRTEGEPSSVRKVRATGSVSLVSSTGE